MCKNNESAFLARPFSDDDHPFIQNLTGKQAFTVQKVSFSHLQLSVSALEVVPQIFTSGGTGYQPSEYYSPGYPDLLNLSY